MTRMKNEVTRAKRRCREATPKNGIARNEAAVTRRDKKTVIRSETLGNVIFGRFSQRPPRGSAFSFTRKLYA